MNILIAKIIDDYTVVINKGKNDGIVNGNRFLIYSELGEVIDPETSEILGDLELPKGYAVVDSLQDKMTIIKSSRYERKTKRFTNALSAVALFGQHEEEERIHLPFERNVKVGDKVKIIE